MPKFLLRRRIHHSKRAILKIPRGYRHERKLDLKNIRLRDDFQFLQLPAPLDVHIGTSAHLVDKVGMAVLCVENAESFEFGEDFQTRSQAM